MTVVIQDQKRASKSVWQERHQDVAGNTEPPQDHEETIVDTKCRCRMEQMA